MKPSVDLDDGIVSLRAWTGSDAPAVAAACSGEEIQRWLPLPSPYTEKDALDYIAWAIEAIREGSDVPLAIADSSSDEVLGSVWLHLGRIRGYRRDGYWVAAHASGRGVATRALRRISPWALQAHGLARLELTTAPDNVASQRVAERAGYTREGVLRSYYEFKSERRDSVIFSLLPSDLGVDSEMLPPASRRL